MPLVPIGPTGLRMSIYDHTGTMLLLDVSSDLAGGDVTYEDTPNGCGAAQLTLGLLYEQVISDGYYTARNIIEISSGDDCVQSAFGLGATKIYVGSKGGYDTGIGHDKGQIALFDGATLTMCIPVTGVGTDGGGDYITVGPPLAAYSNPTSIPAYGAGTIIYRRRYAGIIMGRQLQSSRDPTTIVTCAGLSQRINEITCTFALKTTTVDMGTAMLNLLIDFASNVPELPISPTNFVLTGQTTFDASYQRVQMSSIMGDLLSAAGSGGDSWTLRIGHDRTPRLIRTYAMTGNTYTYNVTLQQGVTYFEARIFQNNDQDASQLYNTIEIIGDTDPVTNNPITAIVQDSLSISLYGEIDAQPVTNTACKSAAQCALYGQSLLNQKAAPRSNATVTVATRNDVYVSGAPMGLSRGDVVLGVHNITVTEISPAPNVYGLVSSAVTTVTPGGDTIQTVRFSAIEPNWNDDIAERANALANALRQNTTTPVAVGSNFIDPLGFQVTINGLTVTTDEFGAIFALGSMAVDCGGSYRPFTLVASTTNWVWLTPSGGWIIAQDPSQQSGCILYAIYTTNATTVVGHINKAATGLVSIPISALPSMGSQASPVLTNVSAISYPVVGNGSYDAQVSFKVDVTSAPWLVGLGLFAMLVGSTEDPHFFPKGSISSFGIIAGHYIAIWKNIGAGNAEDLYVAYEDGQGRYSGAVLVGTTSANPAGTSAFGSVGTTAPNPLSSVSAFIYQHNGGGTYDADCTIFLDANGTTANNNLAELEVVIAPATRVAQSTDSFWTQVGSPIAKNISGIYDVTAGGMGVQVSYTVGIRYVGHDGDRSYVYILGNTTAAQMSQLPFAGCSVDPTTGYLVFADQSIHETTLQYTMPAAGIGSMVSASWSVGLNSIALTPSIWMLGNGPAPLPSSGYVMAWKGSLVYIYKLTSSALVQLAVSGVNFTKTIGPFTNLEFVASMTTAGTLNLTAIINGELAVQCLDSSSPYTSGWIASQFRDATATSYIDDKTISINMGGSPSSTAFKAQANIIPASIPGCYVGIASPTNAGLSPPHGLANHGGMLVAIQAGSLVFSDGSVFAFPAVTLLKTASGGGGADGIWYFSVGMVPATGSGIYYLSQTAPTPIQLAPFYADGVIPVAFSLSFTVIAGSLVVYGNNTTFRHTL